MWHTRTQIRAMNLTDRPTDRPTNHPSERPPANQPTDRSAFLLLFFSEIGIRRGSPKGERGEKYEMKESGLIQPVGFRTRGFKVVGGLWQEYFLADLDATSSREQPNGRFYVPLDSQAIKSPHLAVSTCVILYP